MNNESMAMVWKVGGYVSNKLKSSAWGDGVVRQLAEYIHTQDPAVRGMELSNYLQDGPTI